MPRATEQAIAAGLVATLREEADIAALAATEDAAIAAWTYEGQGGRSVLTRAAQDWQASVISGDRLETHAGLAAFGLHEEARVLLPLLMRAEAGLLGGMRANIAGFEGTIFLQ